MNLRCDTRGLTPRASNCLVSYGNLLRRTASIQQNSLNVDYSSDILDGKPDLDYKLRLQILDCSFTTNEKQQIHNKVICNTLICIDTKIFYFIETLREKRKASETMSVRTVIRWNNKK